MTTTLLRKKQVEIHQPTNRIPDERMMWTLENMETERVIDWVVTSAQAYNQSRDMLGYWDTSKGHLVATVRFIVDGLLVYRLEGR